MSQEFDISLEGSSADQPLKVSTVMPYVVPAGYFVRLPHTVLGRLELLDSPAHPDCRKINHAFRVPEGYFDRFAESVMCRLELADSILGGESKKLGHPFILPTGYLDGAEYDAVPIVEELSGVGGNFHTPAPFEVPSGYFERFFDHLSEGVYAEDPKLLLSRNLPFSTPQGYFESLPHRMAAKVSAATGRAKRIPLPGIRMWKVAGVAAAVAAVVVAAFLLKQERMNTISPDAVLGSVSGTEISEYARQNYLDLDQTAAASYNSALRFDSRDIIKYLNETGWEGTD